MDRHDLAFLVEGVISFILIVVLSLFVSSQSANAKETEKKWKEKECTDLYNAIVLFTKLSGKEWKQKKRKKALSMHQQQQIMPSYIVFFVKMNKILHFIHSKI